MFSSPPASIKSSVQHSKTLDVKGIVWQPLQKSAEYHRIRDLKAPSPKFEHIREFQIDNNLGRDLDVYLIVKSARCISSGNGIPSVVKLPISNHELQGGFLARIKLNGSSINQLNRDPCEISQMFPLDSPRGIALRGDQLLITSFNQLLFIDANTLELQESLTHDQNLFSRLHDVSLSKDKEKALIASTGIGAVFEIDLNKKTICWSWLPWERGFAISTGFVNKEIQLIDGKIFLKCIRRSGQISIEECSEGVDVADLAAPFNAVSYDVTGDYLLTSHFLGQVWRTSGEQDPVCILTNLATPHGFKTDDFFAGYRVVNSREQNRTTIHNTIMWFDQEMNPIYCLDFKDPRYPSMSTWLQNATLIDPEQGIYLVIDATDACIRILNLQEKTQRKIYYPSSIAGCGEVLWKPHEIILAR